MNARKERERTTNLFAIGIYYWLTGDERQADEYWRLAEMVWRAPWPRCNQFTQFPS